MAGISILRKSSYSGPNTPPLARRKSSVESKTVASPPQPDVDIIMSHIHQQQAQKSAVINNSNQIIGYRRSPPQSPTLDKPLQPTSHFELAHGITTIRSYRSTDLPVIRYYIYAQVLSHWYRIAANLSLSPPMLVLYSILLLPVLLICGLTSSLIIAVLILIPLTSYILRFYLITFLRYQNESIVSGQIETIFMKNSRNHVWVATLNEPFEKKSVSTTCKENCKISSFIDTMEYVLNQLSDFITKYLFPLPSMNQFFQQEEISSCDIHSQSLPSQSLIGCIALTQLNDNDKDTCEIHRLFVHPTVRHQHIGSHLLLTAESFARSKNYSRAILTVVNIQKSGIKFFIEHGYEEIAQRYDWRSGITSHIFTKKL